MSVTWNRHAVSPAFSREYENETDAFSERQAIFPKMGSLIQEFEEVSDDAPLMLTAL
jgi:hypothetical protein